MIGRRDVILGAVGGGLALGLANAGLAAQPADRFAALEARGGGRLGVSVLDLQTGARMSHKAGERFVMCSTFKWLAAAAVLARVDQGKERLDRRIPYTAKALLAHSPITEKHVGPGMTLDGLCEAAIIQSDNGAANLILAALGGPSAVTAFARGIGDTVTRLDRTEPALNEGRPGDPRDTTTPDAMVANLRRLVLGDGLKPASRDKLTGWLIANQTGDARLRAGLPKDWRVGDKTGSGDATTNDVAVIWPPGRKPILVAAYLTEAKVDGDGRNAILAEVGRIVASSVVV